MKNFKIILPLFFLISLLASCIQDETGEIENSIDQDLIDLSKVNSTIPLNGSFKSFIENNFEIINDLDENLELKLMSNDQGFFYKVQEFSIGTNNGRSDFAILAEAKSCVTCKDEDCIVNKLTDAIGDGSKAVDITIRVKRDGNGERTGVEVCSEDK